MSCTLHLEHGRGQVGAHIVQVETTVRTETQLPPSDLLRRSKHPD